MKGRKSPRERYRESLPSSIEEWAEEFISLTSGPEHNAYYDMLEVLKIVLGVMTPEQLANALQEWKSKKGVI
jgi:hypothetical protein